MSLSPTPICFIESTVLTGSAVSLYTSPTVTTTIVDNLSLTNTTVSPVSVTIYLVPVGGSPGTGNIVVDALSVPANSVVPAPAMQYQILNPGDSIVALAGSASAVNIRASGRQCA